MKFVLFNIFALISLVIVVSCEDKEDSGSPEFSDPSNLNPPEITEIESTPNNSNPSETPEVKKEEIPNTQNPTKPKVEEVKDSSFEKSLIEAKLILKLVNNARVENGLKKLILSPELNIAAYKHSKDMNDHNYFSHQGLNGSSFGQRAKEANYKKFPRGENIARGQRTAQQVFNGWMNSSGHRRNILSPNSTEMGVGRSGNFWTQVFGA